MIVNDAGRKIITDAEGLRLRAYKCPAGRWTIGYGHTGDVNEGDLISRHQAEVILEYDLQKFESGVSALAPKSNSNEFSALVSFAFNVGLDALRGSTLLKHHVKGLKLNAASEFGKWVHAGGVVLPGLVQRRAAERALYLAAVN